MPCHAAMSNNFLKVKHTETVESVLETMHKKKSDFAVVTGEHGQFEGMFKIQSLFKNLLPVSIAMPDGLQANINLSAAPGIAKRLKKVEPLPVEQFMERGVPAVNPETPLWVAVKLLVEHAGPLVVIEADQEHEKVIGVLDSASVLKELERLKESS